MNVAPPFDLVGIGFLVIGFGITFVLVILLVLARAVSSYWRSR